MPILQPIPIKTKGLTWYKKMTTWFCSSRQWLLMEDFFYTTSEGIRIWIPAGFIFDGASIPRFLWWFLSPVGLLLIAGLIHDFIYRNSFYFDITDGDATVRVKCNRSTADKIFYDIAYEVNDIHFADVPAYSAVRCFGWIAWNKNKKERKGD